jgi:hypothetical protein
MRRLFHADLPRKPVSFSPETLLLLHHPLDVLALRDQGSADPAEQEEP